MQTLEAKQGPGTAEVRCRLAELGSTQAEIAGRLGRAGVRGQPCQGQWNVLAVWLRRQFRGARVVRVQDNCAEVDGTRVSLSRSQAAFLYSYDHGGWPALVSPESGHWED